MKTRSGRSADYRCIDGKSFDRSGGVYTLGGACRHPGERPFTAEWQRDPGDPAELHHGSTSEDGKDDPSPVTFYAGADAAGRERLMLIIDNATVSELERIHGTRVEMRDILKNNNIYVACQTDDDLPYVLQYASEDNLMIGSDYGHNDASSELEAIRRLKHAGTLPAGVVDKILDANPARFYGLAESKTRDPAGEIGLRHGGMEAGLMLQSLLARALATVGKTVATAAVSAAATELRKPDTQARIAAGAQHVASQLRDPKNAERVDQAIAGGARALGRAVGTWRNRT